jgi:site-specific DNA-methyltransferase (cytosine-N4-specific)
LPVDRLPIRRRPIGGRRAVGAAFGALGGAFRDYGIDGQYGLEASPAEYVETMRALFSELRRVLADDGTLWLNIGDSYSGDRGSKKDNAADNKNRAAERATVGSFKGKGTERKNLLGIPWRVAFALQDDGWILRNAIIWNKPNAMPESVTDRLSGRYEMVFMFSKSRKYWFDLDPIREAHSPISIRIARQARANPFMPGKSGEVLVPGENAQSGMAAGLREINNKGRNPGDVWDIPTQPFSAAHFAVMPQQLAQRCIVAGCKPGGTVLDPFSGSGTTGLAAQRLGRKYIGIDLNPEYLKLSLETRLADGVLDFSESDA